MDGVIYAIKTKKTQKLCKVSFICGILNHSACVCMTSSRDYNYDDVDDDDVVELKKKHTQSRISIFIFIVCKFVYASLPLIPSPSVCMCGNF